MYIRVNTCALVKAFINSHHGWAVADQFENTFQGGEEFENQNSSALVYIKDSIEALLDAEILAEDTHEELEEYFEKLEKYFLQEEETKE